MGRCVWRLQVSHLLSVYRYRCLVRCRSSKGLLTPKSVKTAASGTSGASGNSDADSASQSESMSGTVAYAARTPVGSGMAAAKSRT